MHSMRLPLALVGVILLVSSPILAEPPVNQYLPPDQLYGAPNLQQKPLTSGGGSQPGGFGQFGQGSNFGSNQYLPPNQQYGPPGAGGRPGAGAGAGSNGGYGSGYDDSANNAPAKYEFEYTVNDPPSGNDFGHKESRDGDFTRGVYFVLLPDGRRQMVEYEADQDGYRPKVTYMQVGGAGNIGGAGGYPGSGSSGYPGSGSSGYPGSGSSGYPGSGSSGYPGSGSTGYPGSGSVGYPSSGSAGYPSSGSAGYPSSGSGSTGGYPSGGQSGYRY